jgi:hypothetical protein
MCITYVLLLQLTSGPIIHHPTWDYICVRSTTHLRPKFSHIVHEFERSSDSIGLKEVRVKLPGGVRREGGRGYRCDELFDGRYPGHRRYTRVVVPGQ